MDKITHLVTRAAQSPRNDAIGDPLDQWAKDNFESLREFAKPLFLSEHTTKISQPAIKSSGLDYLHGYKNYDTPNCGQAAIATVWNYWGRNYDYCGPRTVRDHYDGQAYWDDLVAVNQGIPSHYPSDVVLGATSPNRICDALRDAQMWNSWAWGPQQTLDNIQGWLNNSPCVPVICLINAGFFENWWTTALHWVVVYKIDGGNVFFANPAVSDSDPPGGLDNEIWRTAMCSVHDFDYAWGTNWTLTKCHIVGHS